MRRRLLTRMVQVGRKSADLLMKVTGSGIEHLTKILPGPASRGLDSPQLPSDLDAMNRHRIAREVYRLMTDNSRDQSVRVGLFGEWGQGKTTIANWVAALAEKDKNIVVNFNPWSVRDASELWFELSSALQETLEKIGIEIPAWSRLKWRAGRFRRVHDNLVRALGGDGLSGVTAAIFRFGKSDVDALVDQLGGRRIVICIDDIDRADPSILPQLLLSLRELLDIPGFAFLIPFEKQIVAKALQAHRPAWDNGERFLEKILDFQITIPESTDEERWLLFTRSMELVVPSDTIRELSAYKALLPDNPRRIKRLARSLDIFASEIDRHNSDEIHWPWLLIGSLMRLESEEFFKLYSARTFANNGEWSAEMISTDRDKREETRQKHLAEMLASTNISDPGQGKRLEALASRWGDDRSVWFAARIAYTLRLFDRPDAFTWREIDRLLEVWKDPGGTIGIADTVAQKESALSRHRDVIVRELLESLAKKYHQHLEAAANAFSTSQHQVAIAQAEFVLERLDAISTQYDIVSVENKIVLFSLLLGAFQTWGHFDANAEDATLRSTEKATLEKLFASRGSAWASYADKLGLDELGDNRLQYNEFVARLRAQCQQETHEQVLDSFRKPDGIAELLRDRSASLAANLLLDPVSSLWFRKDGGSPLELRLSEATDSETVQRNAHALLRLAVGAGGLDHQFERQKFLPLFQDARIAGALWDAATASQIQYRMLQATRNIRRLLVANGIPEGHLSFPDWLHPGEQHDG